MEPKIYFWGVQVGGGLGGPDYDFGVLVVRILLIKALKIVIWAPKTPSKMGSNLDPKKQFIGAKLASVLAPS